MKGRLIRLTAAEADICERLGHIRHEIATDTSPAGGNVREMVFVNRVASIMAAAKMLNVYTDLEYSIRTAWQLRIFGRTVAVKWGKNSYTRMMAAPEEKAADVDLYILVTGTLPAFVVRGWCYRRELFLQEALQVVHGRQYHVLPQTCLRDPLDIFTQYAPRLDNPWSPTLEELAETARSLTEGRADEGPQKGARAP